MTVESVVHSTDDPSSVLVELAVGRTTRTLSVRGGQHHTQAQG
jgi:hypothetical protein